MAFRRSRVRSASAPPIKSSTIWVLDSIGQLRCPKASPNCQAFGQRRFNGVRLCTVPASNFGYRLSLNVFRLMPQPRCGLCPEALLLRGVAWNPCPLCTDPENVTGAAYRNPSEVIGEVGDEIKAAGGARWAGT